MGLLIITLRHNTIASAPTRAPNIGLRPTHRVGTIIRSSAVPQTDYNALSVELLQKCIGLRKAVQRRIRRS